ncbi:short transient receptor potential channel 5-like, partial [Oculina patagonica]
FATLNKKSKRKDVRTPSTLFGYDDEVDSGDVFSGEQQELLDLIERQDVAEVKEFFARAPAFDVSRGKIGRVALRLAIYNERADIAEILLENGVRIGSALFSAVIEGSRECVELFLDKRFFSRARGDIGPTDRREGFFMSPLMLAVRLEDHDIIQYMVSNGFRIDHPDDCQLENQPSSENQEEMQFLLHINSYRALANPLYMGYSYLYNPESEHPLFAAFTLHKTLDRKAIVDHEFKRDYKELSEGCEEFAVGLLEQCRTIDEIKILTDIRPDAVAHELLKNERQDLKFHAATEEAKELAFLNMALRNNNDKVVAHPYSQLRLNLVLHTGIPEVNCCKISWRNRNLLSKVIYSVRHTLLFPFLAIIYLFAPTLPLSVGLANPVVKFISHTGSFAVFLVLLIISAFQDKFHTTVDTPSIVEWMTFIWVIGLAVQELKVFYSQGSNLYRRQWWNLVSLLMVTVFVLSYCFQIIAYGLVGSWAVLDRFRKFVPSFGYQPILIANSLYVVGMVLSFFHISSAFQVNATFGPMQLSLYRLFRDVLKFLVFFALLFVAFGLSLRKLYSHYVSTQYQLAKANGTSNVKGGEGHHFARVDKSMESLFWSLFGLTDLETFEIDKPEFQITRQTGVALFGLYQVLIAVVAINMLIAMMTRSFESIVEAEDLHWKVSRTRMWMNWVNKGSVLPPPYNLIPNPKAVIHFVRRMRDTCRGFNQGFGIIKTSSSGRSHRRDVLMQIVERYLHKRREDSRHEESENLKDIKVTQELMWQELGRRVEGFPKSPVKHIFRRLTSAQCLQRTEETRL